MNIYSYIFQIFSIFAVLSAVLVITSKNPIHSVLYLILVFFNSIVILIFLERDFLAMIFLIVYVGAIAILFLFVVMLLNIKIVIYNLNFIRYIPIAILFIVILYLEFKVILNDKFIASTITSIDYHIEGIQYTNWITKLHVVDNIKSIGLVLYSEYYDLFLLSGVVLLLAMIGAIILTYYYHFETKKQVAYKQLLRVGQLNLYK